MADTRPSVVVTGATGAIGRYLVAYLLSSGEWSRVSLVGRRRWEVPPAWSTPLTVEDAERDGRLTQHIVDMDDVLAGKHDDLFRGFTASICTLGTTHGAAGSNAAFRKIDLDLVAAVARASKAGGARYFSHVTAAGTGGFFSFCTNYGRTKTAAEAAIKALGFPETAIFRPGMLDRGDLARPVERWAMKVLPAVSAQSVARSMVIDAERALLVPKEDASTTPVFRIVPDKAIARQV